MKKNSTFNFLHVAILLTGIMLAVSSVSAQKNKPTNTETNKNALSTSTFGALKFRNIGPAFCSGRIADFAVNPNNPSEYYVAVASGHLWKTTNRGATFEPIFDNFDSYSMASVVIDPNNTNVVWLGTGEYNSQRAIGYGDGVYRSDDAGKTWKNMGLKKSEHIGRIVIDPRNSHIYVAAQGPLWAAGGERGLYKSTDDGKTWNKILNISDNTGVSDIVFDPRNPDILYVSAYQRRRHVWTLINGGPESAIYKSVDAGKTWEKLTNGLPSGDVGRIGLTISPVCPDMVYAIIELPNAKGGFYRSSNRGASWDKMSDYVSTSPQYYQRIVADPKDKNKVYSLDTYTQYTADGGKTWTRLGLKGRHVDDHALWINPLDTKHLLIGGDGGIYESFDGGQVWQHKHNLPVAQFYRIATDNSEPFYYVYGGTQDNNSMGAPSRTTSGDGIVNNDWFNTVGGDGYKSLVDPNNTNIVYAMWQYGGLIRYDKQTGEAIDIKPVEPVGESYRWNWNSPIIISPHNGTTLYFAANKLFKTTDRGNSWTVISPDLTAQIDRNKLEVMGKIQLADAVAKNASTSLFGNIVSLMESPKKQGLLYVGTDDGLIQVTENDGGSWTKYASFTGVPNMTYVSCIYASNHDENIVYASFDNIKRADFKPYLLKSTDKGKSWQSIAANLPENSPIHSIIEDHLNRNLIFIGTEFGIWFTVDGGANWVKMSNGLPTIPVRDMDIQKRENDLVLATFGRGIYILDNYSPIREFTPAILEKEAHLFSIKDALMFPIMDAKYGQGADYYSAQNPAYGATFTYYLKEAPKTLKQKRKEVEKKDNPPYPTLEELRLEEEEEAPYLLFTITNGAGEMVRRIKTAASSGVSRQVWDLRYASTGPVENGNLYEGRGMHVAPGTYKVAIQLWANGTYKTLVEPTEFKVKSLNQSTLPVDQDALLAFQKKVADLSEVARAFYTEIEKLKRETEKMKAAFSIAPANAEAQMAKCRKLIDDINAVMRALNGDETISNRNEDQPLPIMSRLYTAGASLYVVSINPTETMKQQYDIAKQELKKQQEVVKGLEKTAAELRTDLDKLNAPWTPEREIKFD